MNTAEVEGCDLEEVLKGQPHALVMAHASERHIVFLNDEIKALEKEVLRELPDKDTYRRLMTVPGIGPVLARTILLETGPVSRFKAAGNYASYCRAVSTVHTSNGKKKGEGNGKCGNRYPAWAYVEAANCAARFSPEMRAWFQRKQSRSGKRVIAVIDITPHGRATAHRRFSGSDLRIRGVGPRAQARGLEPDERLDGAASAGRKPADETTADSGQEGLSQTHR